MGGGSGSSTAKNQDGKIKSVRQLAIELAELKQKEEIEKYRKQMNFPAEVESTSYIHRRSGSGNPANDEETVTSNKSNTYNRNSKRGTRLVRVTKNG